jgi:hypothetical protein
LKVLGSEVLTFRAFDFGASGFDVFSEADSFRASDWLLTKTVLGFSLSSRDLTKF